MLRAIRITDSLQQTHSRCSPRAEDMMSGEAYRDQVHGYSRDPVNATTRPSRTCLSGALALPEMWTGNRIRARIDLSVSHFRAASAAITSSGSSVSSSVTAVGSCRETRMVRSRAKVMGCVGTGMKTKLGYERRGGTWVPAVVDCAPLW